MRDIVDSHHVDTYQEAATIIDKKAEQLLSPELIEQISNRCIDVFKYGRGISYVRDADNRHEVHKSISNPDVEGAPSNQTVYETLFREGLNPDRSRKDRDFIDFNIVGRQKKRRSENQLAPSYSHFGPGIIFDINRLNETSGVSNALEDYSHLHEQKPEPGTFQINDPDYAGRSGAPRPDEISEQGQLLADTEFGFITADQISPEYFRGVIVNPRDEIEFIAKRQRWNKNLPPSQQSTDEQIIEDSRRKLKATTHPIFRGIKAQEVAQAMLSANASTPDRIIPIYDIDGNMLWPKQMSYEEVKGKVAHLEQEKKKEI